MSSLQLNKTKTEIWTSPNTPKHQQHVLARYFDFKVVHSFGKCLGTYLDGPNRRRDIAREVTIKITKKQGWKARILSQAGRVTCRIVL